MPVCRFELFLALNLKLRGVSGDFLRHVYFPAFPTYNHVLVGLVDSSSIADFKRLTRLCSS